MLALDFISWRNYQELPWELIATGAKNTAILVVLAPTIVVALSLAFSWVVLRSRIRRRAIFDFFAFLPHAVPNIIFAIALLLISLFVLKDIVPIYGTIWVILIGFVIVRLSYRTRMMNGALIQVHRELEEASYISGSRTWACSALC
jgi:iron(III) transport system permease protein